MKTDQFDKMKHVIRQELTGKVKHPYGHVKEEPYYSGWLEELAEGIITRIEQDCGPFVKGYCTCPIGFGAVRDRNCPMHGFRDPNHTITGV